MITSKVSNEFDFHCEPVCAGEARRWLEACLRAELRQQPTIDVLDDALIIASELVTNAINAPCSTGRLGWRTDRRLLWLWVFDDGPGWPQLRQPGPLDVHGRGLRIVRALATQFGTRRVAGGKESWATLALAAV
jgi:anti-sigma regulatory factor (Ser/Thr protein kinase)